MQESEDFIEFYKVRNITVSEELLSDSSHFNVFTLKGNGFPADSPAVYSKRSFYKVSLIRGTNRCHYAGKSIEMSGSTLMFFNPNIPYTWEAISDETGFFCIFKEAFFSEGLKGNIKSLPMFAIDSKPSYSLSAKQDRELSLIFEKMITEIKSDYLLKYDLIRSYLKEIFYFALKLEPAELLYHHSDANARITSVFNELLDRQFPIETISHSLKLRSANDFAKAMAVHVNHLNRAVKQTTGKTTTYHITERVIAEAKYLLKHSKWNISEIGYTLGFEEQAHFYNFFKKRTQMSPSNFREAI